jgi:hypothetical protein
MIMTDPLIEEARSAGQAYIDQFKGDLKAVCADLRRRAREERRQVVNLPPKRPLPLPSPTKKAG